MQTTGFGWDMANFLQSSPHGAVFWIYSQNSVDNTGMVQFMLSSTYIKSRLPLLLMLQIHEGLGVHKDLGWDSARTSDANWPKKCSIPWCIVSNKIWGKKAEGNSEIWCLSSPVTVVCDRALPYWRWLNMCLPIGRTELIPYFVLLVHTAFALPIKLSLSHKFSVSSLHFSLTPVQGGDQLPNGIKWWCAIHKANVERRDIQVGTSTLKQDKKLHLGMAQ